MFIFSIGIDDIRRSTFLSNDYDKGCHFSVAFYEEDTNELWYGDSLAWPAPKTVLPLVQKFTMYLFEKQPLSIKEYHSRVGTSSIHHGCTDDCSKLYPLQNDGNICGVVSLAVASIIALNPFNEKI